MSSEAPTSSWVTLPREIAEKHPLYGIGGWMILVTLRCASIPFTVGPALVPLFLAFGPTDNALLGYIIVEFALRATLVAWALANVFLIFARHRLFPTSYIGYVVVLTLAILAEAVTVYTLQPIADAPEPKDFMRLFQITGAVIGAAVWITYVLISRRVNITFLHRARTDDPILHQTVAEVF